MNTSPTVLIIGIGPLRERFFTAAERRGVNTILVDETAYSRYDRLATENYAWRLADHHKPGPDLDLLKPLADRADGVLALTDWGTHIAADIAQMKGLPGVGESVAQLSDKADVRNRLIGTEAELPFALTADPAEAADLLRTAAHGSVVVKPVDGSASLGVRHITRAQDLPDALAAVMASTGQPHVLVEHYVPGPEVSIEAVVAQGCVRFVSVTEKTCAPASFIETRHVIDPATQVEQVPSATRFVETLTNALGIDNAILHLEAKHDGKNWHLIEVAFRPAGDLISDILLQAAGVDIYDAALALALGDHDPVLRMRQDRIPSVAAVEFVAATGMVADAPSMADVRRGLPLVSRAERLLPPGTTLKSVDANWWRAGYTLASGHDRTEVLSQLAEANARLIELLGLTPLS
ncbi:ATP-grasp domain-containing protein [Streptomyces sp. NPDC004787]|uniref:ATP-grasp domain-containing protein n=1 Tax=Streptomyces sp. NPDC004787 TaxID=3154291 RepID=UPI0033A11FA3